MRTRERLYLLVGALPESVLEVAEHHFDALCAQAGGEAMVNGLHTEFGIAAGTPPPVDDDEARMDWESTAPDKPAVMA